MEVTITNKTTVVYNNGNYKNKNCVIILEIGLLHSFFAYDTTLDERVSTYYIDKVL